ncbi:hypothetical protein HRH25_21230 [Flavisolibacter sp. BT320]|nr:hypothetical protein [Flavisolibacter longurius]
MQRVTNACCELAGKKQRSLVILSLSKDAFSLNFYLYLFFPREKVENKLTQGLTPIKSRLQYNPKIPPSSG